MRKSYNSGRRATHRTLKDDDVALLGSVNATSHKVTVKERCFLYLIAFVHCMGALQFGYNTAIASPALDAVTDEFDLTTKGQELVVSIILVGALVGALGAGYLADLVGRHWLLLANDALFLAGIAVAAAAPLYWVLVLARAVIGLGVGIASVAVPLMVTEIAPKEIRGEIGTSNQLGITIGIFIAYALGTAFANVKYNWRWMFAAAGLFSIIHIVGSIILRIETPRWYALKRKTDKLERVLQRLRCRDDVSDDMLELQQMDEEGGNSIVDAFMALKWRVLVISLGLNFFQQITGINAIMYYMSSFFQLAGMSSDDSNIVSMVIGAINVAMTAVSVFLLDRAGRKPLLIYGLVFMFFSLMCIAVAFFFQDDMLPATLGGICVVCTIWFIIGFAISMGPVPWIIISELCANECRALVMSLSLAVSWLTNLGLSLSFLSLIKAMGEGTVFFCFSILSAIALVFTLVFISETKGRSPSEIEDIAIGKGERRGYWWNCCDDTPRGPVS